MFVFTSFQLDVANASLRRGKQALFLTPKAFNVLRYLVEHAGQLVTKDDLWRAVWAGVTVTDAALTVCVSEIRKALGDEPKRPRYIETVHRLGYRFIARVSTQPVWISDSGVRGEDFKPARNPQPPTPHFVGRGAELAQLHNLLERAVQGERQIVFVTGEPGIGKTTLVEEFLQREQVSREERLWIGRGQCIEHYGRGEAYLPLLDALGQLCRESGGRRLVGLLDKYAPAWLVQMPALLSAADRRDLQEKVADATCARMLRELADAMEVISSERPLVLRLEDLHWSDYSTLEWLSFLAQRQGARRLFVLATYRPVEVIVREHPLRALKDELLLHGLCTELPLALLSERAVMEYLTLRFSSPLGSNSSSGHHQGEGADPEPLRKLAHTIYQRTDGNPLFIVNVVDYLVEHEGSKPSGDAALAQPGVALGADRIDTPPSIVQLIERNLERLNADEQAVLEAASVAGAEFPAAAVAAALERPFVEIETCCTRLSRRQQFVQPRGTQEWPDGTVAASFQFLHSLYRDVLYKRVPPGRRLELHRRIAEREEKAYGESAREIAVELAYHYTEARLIQQAIPFWERAGRRAIDRSANIEAISHFAKGLELLKSTPDSPERIQQELRLQMVLGGSLMATKGFSAPEAGEAYGRALELCRKVGETSRLLPVLGVLAGFNCVRGELRTARRLAEQLLCLVQNRRNPAALQAAHYMSGEILHHLGELLESRTHLEQAIALYDPQKPRSRVLDDPGVACLGIAARTLWVLGYPDQALRRIRECLSLARQLSRPFSLANGMQSAVELYQCRGEVEVTQEQAETLIALSEEQGFTQRVALGLTWRGWTLAKQGRTEEGIAQIRKGLATTQVTGDGLFRPYFLGLLAEAYAEAGQPEEGHAALSEALDVAKRTGIAVKEPELYRLKGELLTMQSNLHEAESCFQLAIEIAQKQSAKSWELRATTSLARLLTHHGRRDEARKMLAEIYNWFIEGFDTADLKDAKAVLDELSA